MAAVGMQSRQRSVELRVVRAGTCEAIKERCSYRSTWSESVVCKLKFSRSLEATGTTKAEARNGSHHLETKLTNKFQQSKELSKAPPWGRWRSIYHLKLITSCIMQARSQNHMASGYRLSPDSHPVRHHHESQLSIIIMQRSTISTWKAPKNMQYMMYMRWQS